MKRSRRLSYSQVCLLPYVLGFGFSGLAHANPLPSPKTTASAMKKPEIPLPVLKDIRRVHPGMTRADLDWLFTPDGGFIGATPRAYIYRYAAVGVTAVDATGKPVLDKVTHKPFVYGQVIKIDVAFRPATGRSWVTENKTGHHFVYLEGRSDDVIVSVSDPYADFPHDD